MSGKIAPPTVHSSQVLPHPVEEREGVWRVSSHEQVSALIRDARLTVGPVALARSSGPAGPLLDLRRRQLINIDGTQHRVLRAMVNRAFTPRAVAGLRDEIFQRAQRMVDVLPVEGLIDIIPSFAFALPVATICDLLGLPGDVSGVQEWSSALVRSFDPDLGLDGLERADAAVGLFRDHLLPFIEDRRRSPQADLVSQVVTAAVSEGLEDDDVLANVILLFTAGFETTMGLISNGVLLLLGAPDQAEEVRRTVGSGGLQRAVEEVLRFESPIRSVARVATERIELDGVVVEEGRTVILDLAVANRDPERFERPDVFDVSRVENPHLAFGGGPHFCVGAGLARLEGAVALGAILDLLPELELVEGGLVWKDHPTVHCPATLMVRRRT